MVFSFQLQLGYSSVTVQLQFSDQVPYALPCSVGAASTSASTSTYVLVRWLATNGINCTSHHMRAEDPGFALLHTQTHTHTHTLFKSHYNKLYCTVLQPPCTSPCEPCTQLEELQRRLVDKQNEADAAMRALEGSMGDARQLQEECRNVCGWKCDGRGGFMNAAVYCLRGGGGSMGDVRQLLK